MDPEILRNIRLVIDRSDGVQAVVDKNKFLRMRGKRGWEKLGRDGRYHQVGKREQRRFDQVVQAWEERACRNHKG